MQHALGPRAQHAWGARCARRPPRAAPRCPSAACARRVNGNLNLSRAIGDLKYKGNTELPPKDQIITAQPDIMRIALTPEDTFFLLACDGVWDVMTNQVSAHPRAPLSLGAAPRSSAAPHSPGPAAR